jgi:hypothetical protein
MITKERLIEIAKFLQGIESEASIMSNSLGQSIHISPQTFFSIFDHSKPTGKNGIYDEYSVILGKTTVLCLVETARKEEKIKPQVIEI